MKIFTSMATTNQNRLLTSEVMAAFEGHELYSQDGKKKDAKCIAVFRIGNIRWYFIEGQEEGEDFIFYGVVLGLVATEYGYVSANEMASISIDASKYALSLSWFSVLSSVFLEHGGKVTTETISERIDRFIVSLWLFWHMLCVLS